LASTITSNIGGGGSTVQNATAKDIKVVDTNKKNTSLNPLNAAPETPLLSNNLIDGNEVPLNVLEKDTNCSPYLTTYLSRTKNKNQKEEIKKLQKFLNTYSGEHLPLTGYF
jgi:hypothetical protein